MEQLLGAAAAGEEAGRVTAKKRKPRPKLTEEMMVGMKGLSHLVERSRTFKKKATSVRQP